MHSRETEWSWSLAGHGRGARAVQRVRAAAPAICSGSAPRGRACDRLATKLSSQRSPRAPPPRIEELLAKAGSLGAASPRSEALSAVSPPAGAFDEDTRRAVPHCGAGAGRGLGVRAMTWSNAWTWEEHCFLVCGGGCGFDCC
jgi:hypothetical protein